MAKHPAAQPFRNVGWVHLDEFDSLALSSAKGSHVFHASQGLSTAGANAEPSNTHGTADSKPNSNDADESQEQVESASESQVTIDWVCSFF